MLKLIIMCSPLVLLEVDNSEETDTCNFRHIGVMCVCPVRCVLIWGDVGNIAQSSCWQRGISCMQPECHILYLSSSSQCCLGSWLDTASCFHVSFRGFLSNTALIICTRSLQKHTYPYFTSLSQWNSPPVRNCVNVEKFARWIFKASCESSEDCSYWGSLDLTWPTGSHGAEILCYRCIIAIISVSSRLSRWKLWAEPPEEDVQVQSSGTLPWERGVEPLWPGCCQHGRWIIALNGKMSRLVTVNRIIPPAG